MLLYVRLVLAITLLVALTQITGAFIILYNGYNWPAIVLLLTGSWLAWSTASNFKEITECARAKDHF